MAQTLAQLIRAKYPGQYDDLSDQDLEAKVRAKYPGVYDDLPKTPASATKPAPSVGSSAAPTFQQLAAQGPSATAGPNGPQGVAFQEIAKHPVTAASTVGALAAVPLTGGVSALPNIAAAGLGGAGGAGIGSIIAALTGQPGPRTASDVAKTMAAEGASQAAGQALGEGANAALKGAGKIVYRAALRPSLALQRDFGDISSAGLSRRFPVSDAGAQTADAGIGRNVDALDGILAAKDAERPSVAGYLPPPRGVPLPQANGVLLRENPAIGSPWDQRSVYGAMVAPSEISDALTPVRADLSNRALAHDATSELDALKQRFLQQHPAPMTLRQTQALKQSEQDLANTAYKAMNNGAPVNSVDAQFHKGVATGARAAIESRVPQAAPINADTQELMGIRNAIENARMRNIPGVGLSPRSVLGDFAPSAASHLAIWANTLGGTPVAPTMLRLLAAALAGGGQ